MEGKKELEEVEEILPMEWILNVEHVNLLSLRHILPICQGGTYGSLLITEIGKKAWLFAKLEPDRAMKRNNAT